MTFDETQAIMAILYDAYPLFYRGVGREDADRKTALWAEMFADEPVGLVAAAVKAYIAQDINNRPPGIGVIKNAIIKLTAPEEMTELEAWSLVRGAISGASMSDDSRVLRGGVFSPPSAVVKFEQLPPILQRLVGTPSRLAEWAMVPNDKLETVVQSNFMRSYKARAAHEREYMALPADVRQTMEALAEGMKMPQLPESL